MTKQLLHHHKQSQSTTDLELNQARLKRKAADLLMKNLEAESKEDFEEFKYEEHAEEMLRLKRERQQTIDERQLIEEEIKDEPSSIE